MAEVLLSKNAITVYEVLVILVLVVILVRQKKKNRELQERREITNAKIRNQKLEQKLKNPDSDMDWSKDPNPFEVQYMPEAEAHVKAASDLQIEIEVHTEMSVQRYLFDLNEEITIGRNAKNVLPLKDAMAAERSCTIFMKNRAVYVRNESVRNPVCIQRGKKKQFIQNQIVKLQSKDILTFGKTALHISIYEI